MIRKALTVVLVLIIYACKEKVAPQKEVVNNEPKNEQVQKLSEADLVLHKEYAVGDVRRYGIFPDSSFTYTHPVSKKPKITTILDLAEEDNVELFFPEGFYNMGLILDGRQNIRLRFDKAAFDIVHITKDTDAEHAPSNIKLKGSLITYDRLGITDAKNVEIDSVYIRSDTIKNHRKIRSRGCHIYYGCKNITIKYLEIDDFGSGDERYYNNHAALALDGWRNNPENVNIHKLYIKSTDRHGIYLTGKNHMINEVIIDRFGIGNDIGMTGMQDAGEIEYKLFSGIWINRCYNSTIGEITINSKMSKGFFTANFDEGDSLRPVIINKMKIKNFDRKLPIRFAKNTGVIVKETIQ